VDLITKNGDSKKTKTKKVMRWGCIPVSAKLSKISQDLLFCPPQKKQKRSSPLDCTP